MNVKRIEAEICSILSLTAYARLRTKKISWRWFLVSLSVLVVCTGCISTPAGAYYDKYIGTIEPSYWIFRDGSVYLHSKDFSDQLVGSYVKSENTWLLKRHSTDDDVTLIPGVFGIRMVPTNGASPDMNRYLPRHGFAWINSGRNYDSRTENIK
jgi:hypothetical protein